MVRATHRLRRAEGNWHVAVTRTCIARQKALVEAVKGEQRDVSGPQAIVALAKEVLRPMLARREFTSWALSIFAESTLKDRPLGAR
jgi:hypothetical protein